jgi:uncharacterized phage protein gp47/JayE
MAKIVNNVLERETLAQVRNKIRGYAVQNFQDILPYGQSVDTDPSTLLGRLIDITAESTYDIEEVLEYLMSSVDLDTATGSKLEDLVRLGNVFRKDASPSTAKLVVKARPLTVIPQGSFVKSQYTSDSFTTDFGLTVNSVQGESGVYGYDFNVIDTTVPTSNYEFVWKRDSSPNTNITISLERGSASFDDFVTNLASVINQNTAEVLATYQGNNILTVITTNYNEEVSLRLTNSTISAVFQGVDATSVEVGSVIADMYTLTTIQTPINGWLAVYNPFDASIGKPAETDEELRTSYRERLNFAGAATLNAMLAAIYNLDGVKHVAIRENNSTGTSTIPPNSFAVTVLGGRRDDIAQAIFDHKPLGINPFGVDVGFAQDINGNTYDIQYSRPEFVPIAVRLAITQQAGFTEADYGKIRQSIIDYFNTFQVGSSVTYSRLYSPINKVPNHYVNSLEIGLIINGVPTFGTNNIELGFNQLATINQEDIQFV